VSALGFEGQILPLDIAGSALRGPHRHLALGGDGPVVRYAPDVAVFASMGSDDPDAGAWVALSALPGDTVALLADAPIAPGPGWSTARELPVLLMSGSGAEAGEPEAEIVALGPADVPEMLDLVARTHPGPFLSRTIEFGGYLGVRRGSILAAMAGRRMHPQGWIEVSAVCTDPAYRGAGLARELIKAVVWRIRAEGAEPFLHVVPANPALGIYESLGFSTVRESVITGLQRTG
jgi:ribosomal protein S18 acetylase RimI-like enzyme